MVPEQWNVDKEAPGSGEKGKEGKGTRGRVIRTAEDSSFYHVLDVEVRLFTAENCQNSWTLSFFFFVLLFFFFFVLLLFFVILPVCCRYNFEVSFSSV
tara:strand:- start:190 stop:483 length:294 start_codon:yes stop_codon:yes gene_type:complete